MRIKDTVLRRRQIKESVIDNINESNLNKFNITDISKITGFARKTIYVYYSSMDDILLDIYTDSLLKRYELAKFAIKNSESLKDKLYKIAQVSFNYYKKDKAALLIHLYWSSLNFDFSKANTNILVKFNEANKKAYDFLDKNLFHLEKDFADDYDFFVVNFLDNIHQIIKRALLEPNFWSYNSTPLEYFEKAINLYLRGLNLNN